MSFQSIINRDPIGRKWPLLVQVILGRLVLLGMLLIGLTAMTGKDDSSFYAFIALGFVVNIPLALWLRNDVRVRRAAPQQFLLDIILITGLVHFTGGVNSQLQMLYPLVILTSGVVVSGRLAIKMAILAILMYSILIFVESRSWLPYLGTGEYPYKDMNKVVQDIFMRVLVFAFFAGASGYLADRCAYQNREIAKLKREIEFVFNNVTVALLAVEPNGKLVLVNNAALELFKIPARAWHNFLFKDFFMGNPPELSLTVIKGEVLRMKRADGSEFVGAYEASPAKLPSSDFHYAGEDEGDGHEIFVVAVRDVSKAMQEKNKEEQDAKIKTAVSMASEVGHWIRNPLTSLKVAGEFVGSVFSKEHDLQSDELEMVSSMCKVISEETLRLEDRVEYLLHCADENQERLADMVAEAEGWQFRTDSENKEK